jgi:cytochrome c
MTNTPVRFLIYIPVCIFLPPIAALLLRGLGLYLLFVSIIWSASLLLFFKYAIILGIATYAVAVITSILLVFFKIQGSTDSWIISENQADIIASSFAIVMSIAFTLQYTLSSGQVILVESEQLTDTHNSITAGKNYFLKHCIVCHKTSDENFIGPGLAGVVGSKIANRKDYTYSLALRDKEGNWSEQRLREFLTDTTGFAPGTKMVIKPLTDEQAISVTEYLKTNSK